MTGFRPDQCPECGSLRVYYSRSDGQTFDLIRDAGKLDLVICISCGHSWPFAHYISNPAGAKPVPLTGE